MQVLQEDIGLLSSLCPALWEELSAVGDRVVPSLLFLGQCCQGMLPGTPASILSTSMHCPTRGTREPSCTVGAGVALTGRGCNHHPAKDKDVQCRAQKEEIKCSIESVWVFWLKKVQVLVCGSKHAVCLMNVLFISCVSCWKYQSG